MDKKVILIAMLLLASPVLAAPPERKTTNAKPKIDVNTVYYPNASMRHAIDQFRAGNFTGCLQESISVMKKDPSNPLATYYVGLSFAKVGDKESAVQYLDKAAGLSDNTSFIKYVTEAKDCVNGADSCKMSEEDTELMKLINSPFNSKNGFTPEVKNNQQQKELDAIKQKMNSDKYLNLRFDDTRMAMASEDEILNAIRVLKDSGVSITVNMSPQFQDEQMAQMQMFSSGNNNNNSNNAIMSLIPMMMNQETAKNVDPQVIQAIMMQSMMPDFGGFGSNNNNR
jgi:hypothetical protein